MIISRSQKFALLFLMLLALFITACGGGAAPTETEAPTEPAETTEAEPTEDPSEVEATESPTEAEAEVAVDSGVVADTFPCAATIVEATGLMRILMRQPSATAPLVGARRGGQAVELGELVTNDEGNWYGIVENRFTVGYIAQEYIILGEACVSGGGAGAEATAEATQEG